VTPAWSPDGTKIAFSMNRTGVYQIWVMNADGTEQVQLTHSSVYETNPVWSPDGSKIAWLSDRPGPGQAIWIMDADGQNQMSLTAGNGSIAWPTWTR
jgi:Tol biopolymer transport system component